MVSGMPKKIMKNVYHILTSGNADIAFYTDVFSAGNKEWIMKRPVKFALHLIKINLDCRLPYRTYRIKGLAPGKKCIGRIYRRPKVYQYAMSLMGYSTIITDLFGTLLEYSLEKETIFKLLEEELKIPGFATKRRKKENIFKPLEQIYQELSNDFNVTITKEAEIALVKRQLIINAYVNKVFEIAAYNQITIRAQVETNYSVADIREFLTNTAIASCEIQVSSEQMLSFYNMCDQYTIQSMTRDRGIRENAVAIVSANYNNAIKHAKRYGMAPHYYRSAKEIMKSIPVVELNGEWKEVYQTIAGLELFGGLAQHKNLYECTYLYLAPVVYALLATTRKLAQDSNSKVIALCDSECIFYQLYDTYFGDLTTCIWSGMAGTLPSTEAEWNYLLEDDFILQSFPADRIAYALGFSFPPQTLLHCKDEFIQQAIAHTKGKTLDTDAIRFYLNHYLRNEKRIVVVDPMPGMNAVYDFTKYTLELNPEMEIQVISLSRLLNRDARALSIFGNLMQMDIPYMMGFYQNEKVVITDPYQMESEISFLQPSFVNEIKKRTIQGALEDFCKAFTSYENENKNLIIEPSDLHKILEYSKEGMAQLAEELGGIL